MTPHLNTELSWSEWVPFGEALDRAPRKPGVYTAREQATGQIVYIGILVGVVQRGKYPETSASRWAVPYT